MRHPDKLEEIEQEHLVAFRRAGPSLDTTYQLVQDFLLMIRKLEGERLDAWLTQVHESQLAELESFAHSVEQDKAAVQAELTLPIDNRSLEGHINRLKLIKRSMYGRAEFDLLKMRVLYQSKNVKERKEKHKNRQTQQPVDRLKKPRRMKKGTTSQYTTIEISKPA